MHNVRRPLKAVSVDACKKLELQPLVEAINALKAQEWTIEERVSKAHSSFLHVYSEYLEKSQKAWASSLYAWLSLSSSTLGQTEDTEDDGFAGCPLCSGARLLGPRREGVWSLSEGLASAEDPCARSRTA